MPWVLRASGRVSGWLRDGRKMKVDVRETPNPTAVPRTIGVRTASAGLVKTCAGRVRDGM